jgi:hypothetical protein
MSRSGWPSRESPCLSSCFDRDSLEKAYSHCLLAIEMLRSMSPMTRFLHAVESSSPGINWVKRRISWSHGPCRLRGAIHAREWVDYADVA